MKYVELLKKSDEQAKEEEVLNKAAFALADTQKHSAFLTKAIIIARGEVESALLNFNIENLIAAKNGLSKLQQEKEVLDSIVSEYFGE